MSFFGLNKTPKISSTSIDALARHQALRQDAHAHVSRALDLEGLGDSNRGAALREYQLGRDSILAAIGIVFDNDADRRQAQTVNDQMAKTLKQVEERIRELGVKNTSQPARPPPKPATTAKGTNSVLQDLKKQNIDSVMATKILNEVLVEKPGIEWSEIAGLETAKQALKEIVILPFLRPDLFTGLRAPAQGVLLYGPPGSGKTLLARALATEAKAVFFSISASSLTSKFVGESERMVRTLFACARALQPAIVFIDEVDSILSARSDNENEATRRLKTEFLLQFDGMGSSSEDRVLIIGATNRPKELDEAARRRFVKRIYIPLPDAITREQLLRNLLKTHTHSLSDRDVTKLVKATDGYSGSDLTALAREAALGPIRQAGDKVLSLQAHQLRPISSDDFTNAMKVIRKSVAPETLRELEEFSKEFGMSGA